MAFKFNVFSGTLDLVNPSSSGGTPGGTPTQLQFNDSGSFGGLSLSAVNNTDALLGIQTATPLVPLHVTGAQGAVVPSPASATASYTLETVVDSPVTYAVSEELGPSSPSSVSSSIIYISAADSTTSGADQTGSGFVSQGQTWTYQVYCYRAVGGTRVVSPNFFQFQVTDTINDGSSVDVAISGIAGVSGDYDGFILLRTDDIGSTAAWTDIGSVSSYLDQGFTNQDAYELSGRTASSSTWTTDVYQYKILGSTKYNSALQAGVITDSGSGQYIIIQTGWAAAVDDGFQVQSTGSFYFDLGTSATFYDWGQSAGSVPAYAFWDTDAFPIFSTAPLTNPTPDVPSLDYGPGSLIADGSTWSVEAWEYKTNPLNGIKYFVPSGQASSGTPDDSSGNPFTVSGTYSVAGDASGSVVFLLKNGSVVSGLDIAAATSYAGLDSQTPPATTPALSTYTGVARTFTAYGFITSPSTKYSSTNNVEGFADTNTGPYRIKHVLTTAGNATGEKVLQVIGVTTTHVVPITNVGTYYQENPDTDNNLVITPGTIGFIGDGSVYAYSVYAVKSIGVTAYSGTPATSSVTLPNDSNHYIISLTNATVSGATYKAKRIIGGGSPAYRSYTSPPIQDDATISWSDSSTLTPTSGPISGGYFDRDLSALNEPPALVVRNINSSSHLSSLGFNILSGATQKALIGTNSLDDFYISSDATGLVIGPLSSPGSAHTVIKDGGSGTLFNVQANSTYKTTFLGGSSSVLLNIDSATNTACFGAVAGTGGIDYLSTIVSMPAINDAGLTVVVNTGSNASLDTLKMTNSGNLLWGVNGVGQMHVHTTDTALSVPGHLIIGGADSNNSQIVLQSTSTLPSTPVPGGIDYKAGDFFLTNASAVRSKILTSLATSTNTQFWRSDSNGNPIADSTLFVQAGVVLAANLLLEAKQGISIDGNQDITMGPNSRISANIRYTYTASSANKTANTTDYLLNATANSFNYTLPTAVGISGRTYVIHNSGSGVSTILTTSSQTIDGQASGAITLAQYQSITVHSDGANWIKTASVSGATIATSLTSGVTGVLPRANGGTAQTLSPILFTHIADVNNSGTSETDLYSDTIAAGKYATNGDVIEAQYGGTFTGAATATQQLRLYLGGTLIFDSGALSIGVTTVAWNAYVTTIRESSSIVRTSVSLTTSFASLSAYTAYTKVTGLTLANTQILKITGTAGGVGGASNQITASEGYVEYKSLS